MFVDQSGFYLLPSLVRTYAPVGQTPVLHEKLTREHLSLMSGITPEGKLLMLEQERAFKGEDSRFASSSTLSARYRASS
jgi:hypothetical protein